MPVYDRYVLFFGTANDGEEKDNFKRKKLPVSIEEISKWNKGDAVFWASQGGAQFTAGVGWYIATVGTRVLVQGGFDHYVEKVGENKVYVSTGTRKIRTISVMGGVAFNYASLDTLFEKGASRSFEVELVDEEHLNAYRSFLKGSDSALLSLIE